MLTYEGMKVDDNDAAHREGDAEGGTADPRTDDEGGNNGVGEEDAHTEPTNGRSNGVSVNVSASTTI